MRTYGMNVIEYFPYLKLGTAYYRLEQYGAALQAFETEERLGAIRGSQPALRELHRLREQTLAAQQAAAAAERRRIDQIVLDGLSEAQAFAEQGRLDEAMSALGRGLAVDPDNAEVQAALQRLRDEAGRQQAAFELDARLTRLRQEGLDLLGEKRFGEAASVLRQALSLRPGDELRSLLAEAQAGLRAGSSGAAGMRAGTGPSSAMG